MAPSIRTGRAWPRAVAVPPTEQSSMQPKLMYAPATSAMKKILAAGQSALAPPAAAICACSSAEPFNMHHGLYADPCSWLGGGMFPTSCPSTHVTWSPTFTPARHTVIARARQLSATAEQRSSSGLAPSQWHTLAHQPCEAMRQERRRPAKRCKRASRNSGLHSRQRMRCLARPWMLRRTFWYVSGGGEKSGAAMTGMGCCWALAPFWGCAPLPPLCCEGVLIKGDAVARGRRDDLPAANRHGLWSLES